ncbi:putative RNA-directed DNA polymerase from transposon BS [Trichonephila clavipes]|nr:putative RNA-directed DNA polymerase from transposon BS [Trichonephila clavipes]
MVVPSCRVVVGGGGYIVMDIHGNFGRGDNTIASCSRGGVGRLRTVLRVRLFGICRPTLLCTWRVGVTHTAPGGALLCSSEMLYINVTTPPNAVRDTEFSKYPEVAVCSHFSQKASFPGFQPLRGLTFFRSLNSCRGVISEPDHLSSYETEILEGLFDQGVTQVRKITIKKDSSLFSTKHFILTFNSPILPSAIKAGYLNCKVCPYIPNPLRCFKCQRFGHSQTSCRGLLTCSRCASVGHASTDCSLEPKCINRLQPHSSDSKICPKWKIEKQIQEIKTTKNISYPEARKLIVPQLSQTYAQAAKSSTLNNSTQTDENITKINCPPLKLLAPLSSKQSTHIPTAVTTSSSAQTQLLPSISSKTSTTSDPQPPTPMSETKGKIKEQPSLVQRPRKDRKKNTLNELTTYNKFKEKSCKNTSVKIARKQDSPNESTPVSKRSRRRKTSKTSDAMDTDTDPSDTDYFTGLASEEDEPFRGGF